MAYCGNSGISIPVANVHTRTRKGHGLSFNIGLEDNSEIPPQALKKTPVNPVALLYARIRNEQQRLMVNANGFHDLLMNPRPVSPLQDQNRLDTCKTIHLG